MDKKEQREAVLTYGPGMKQGTTFGERTVEEPAAVKAIREKKADEQTGSVTGKAKAKREDKPAAKRVEK